MAKSRGHIEGKQRVIIIVVCVTGVILVVEACNAFKTVNFYELD